MGDTDSPAREAHVWWIASPDKSAVVLREDIPAGEYTVDEARQFGARFTEAAQKAADANTIALWLSEAGCPPEVISRALESWRDKSKRGELLSAFALFSKGLF